MARIVRFVGLEHIVEQGRLPNRIWNHPDLVDYLNHKPAFGYVGSFNRTVKSDRVVMWFFRQIEASESYIIREFLTHSRGRHIADEFVPGISSLKIIRIMKRNFNKQR